MNQWDPGCSTRADGRTEMTQLIVAFRNVPSNPYDENWYNFLIYRVRNAQSVC
jgi:hypothetical protein